jgi:hypothetical protein
MTRQTKCLELGAFSAAQGLPASAQAMNNKKKRRLLRCRRNEENILVLNRKRDNGLILSKIGNLHQEGTIPAWLSLPRRNQ